MLANEALYGFLKGMKFVYTIIVLVCMAVSTGAQETYYSVFTYDHFIPEVEINDKPVSLQRDLYPEWYYSHSVKQDMRWVREHDSSLVAFWNNKGDTLLHVLCELSGIEWQEQTLQIYLLRYFPSPGSSSPFMFPVGGIKKGVLIESVPVQNVQEFYFVYLLAKRMLDQSVYLPRHLALQIASHPLMRHSPYRRDNLALLLAYSTFESVVGIDSAKNALNSAFIKRHMPGLLIFKRYFLNKWVLTPDNTLRDWVAQVSYSSPLVQATRPPRPVKKTSTKPIQFIEGVPLKGKLGFSVHINDNGFLVVDSIDAFRLGYACGLRTGDRIRSVNGARVRTHRKLVEKIYETLNEGGATLSIIRDGKNLSIIIQPMDLAGEAVDSDYPEEQYQYIPADSVFDDSIR